MSMHLVSLRRYDTRNYDFFKNQTPTVFNGEAVHDGHPIEPVVVAGGPHRKDTGAIAQQGPLQPAGNTP